MRSVTFSSISNNHKLYFSRSELTKILNCYSIGVSRGNWKDYALDFKNNEAAFLIYKHTLARPEYVLKKYREKKKKKSLFYLSTNSRKNKKFENIDKLIISIKRSQFSILN